MLKRFYPAAIAAATLAFGACADEELAPIITFTDLEVGAFPRLVSLDAGEYDLESLGSTAIQWTVEFVDGGDGSEVSNYRVYGTFQDRNPDFMGDKSSDRILIRDVGPGDFGTSEEGLPSYTFTLPATEVFSLFGVEADDLAPGDRLFIQTEVEKNGIVYNVDNSTSAITAAFGGLLNYNAVFTCPLPDDFLVGDYRISYTDGDPNGGFGSIFGDDGTTVTLGLVPGSSTRRQYDAGYLPGIGPFDVTGVIDFVCTTTNPLTIDSGVGCGGGSIEIGSGGSGEFDISDDGEFVVNYIQFSADGGCGVAPAPVQLTFTKQ